MLFPLYETGGEEMERAAGIVFFFAWLLCGCTIDQALDNQLAGTIFAMAIIVAIACAWVIGHRKD